MLPRGVDQRDDVVDQFGLDVNSGGLVLHGDQLVARKHLTDGLQWIDALPGEHHIALILRCGISDGQPYGEPVHLRIRQQLRTSSAGRVLRGKDDERLRDRWLTPSTVTWPSSMASRSADCVREVARFSSSARNRLQSTAPG